MPGWYTAGYTAGYPSSCCPGSTLRRAVSLLFPLTEGDSAQRFLLSFPLTERDSAQRFLSFSRSRRETLRRGFSLILKKVKKVSESVFLLFFRTGEKVTKSD